MREHEDLKRYWSVEVRASAGLKLVGKIPYKSLSEPIGYNGEREMLWPGCFAESIKRNDIYLIVSHDSTRPLASSASGTLRMKDGPLALSFEADLPNTQAGRDLHESIKRGDFKKMSFGFNSIDRRLEDIDGEDVLVLYKGNLLELSPVVWPAYGSTEVSARSKTNHNDSNELQRIESKMKQRKAESIEMADRFFGNNDKKMFGTFGEHLRAVALAELSPDKNNIDQRFQLERAASGMNESFQSDGGFLTQPGFSESILFGKFSSEIVKRCMTLRLQNSRTNLPVFASDDRTNGLYESIQVYKILEGDALTPSDGTFVRSLMPKLNKLASLSYMTSELLEDAGTLERYFKRFMGQAMSYELERQVVAGSGVGGECLGLVNSPCKITIAKELGQDAGTIVGANIVNAKKRLLTESHNSASTVWIANPNVLGQLYNLVMPGLTGNAPLYKFGAPGEPGMLMGHPVLVSDHAKTLGDEGDIILADLSTYLLSMMASQYGVSSHVNFLNDENAFRLTIRVDGMSIYSNPVTVANGSDTLSPVIVLAAR